MTKVPRAVARCPCYYLYDDELGRPKDFTVQQIEPQAKYIVDDSTYGIVRAGVMLSSGIHPQQDVELRTTSGILIKDRLGNQYMTVSSHIFPFGAKVYHPVADGKENR